MSSSPPGSTPDSTAPAAPSAGAAISGRQRRRGTTPAVRVAEATARTLITVGGLGTIVAVTTIMVFLASVVVPLFREAGIEPVGRLAQGALATLDDGIAHLEVDEYLNVGWAWRLDGSLSALRLDTGEEIERSTPFPGAAPTALHVSLAGGRLAFGFADGTVRLGRAGFVTRFLGPEEAAELSDLAVGEIGRIGRAIVQRTPEGQLRAQEFQLEIEEPLVFGSAAAVVALTEAADSTRELLTVLKADGRLERNVLSRKKNLFTGQETLVKQESELPFAPPLGRGPPRYLLQSELGDAVYLAWDDGLLQRYDLRDDEEGGLAETIDLVPEEGERLTALRMLVGATTLVAGDSLGRVTGWFTARPEGSDEMHLVRAHELPRREAAVTALDVSMRNRVVVAGYADGALAVLHVTSDRLLAETSIAAAGGERDLPVEVVALSPRTDGVIAQSAGGLARFSLSLPHPETALRALFLPLWYEGSHRPEHIWQSSSGTDDFEPKLGLWPLVFGTLKATLYSLLFSVPVALLAAIYTSEFLSKPVRSRVKPAIEMMASLPSVVLGFLAALVVAPFLEDRVPQVLASFVTVPLGVLTGAYLWQLLPQPTALRLAGWPRFGAMLAAVVAGLGAGVLAGPGVERALFAGDIRAWLDGQRGDAVGGWMFLTLPLAAAVVLLAKGRFVAPALRRAGAGWSRERSAAVDFAQYLTTLLVVLALSLGIAQALDGAGWDPRGTYLDTYVQRNALVVGFLTGFAVIPIIYTLAEDALTAVPDHLRAASLAAGATPWQTAVRIVVPTAMSGLFSAVMVGLGRVVGETMIVLMAAGNTPVLEWNIFNGFRTLSATIAVELPEAVQDGTLYRVLFLAALTLFAITFLVNTAAEVVRQRFRRRAYEL